MSKLVYVAVLAVSVAACATAPKTPQEQQSLVQEAQSTVTAMVTRDPTLKPVLDRSYGYAVFPSIGEAGAFVAGGSYGRGVLFEHGQPAGFVTLTQGSFGPQLGGQTYAELIALNSPQAVQAMKGGKFSVGGQVSGVVLKAGAAASANFSSNMAVFIMQHGGLMAGISVTGQQINFQPMAG